MRFTDFKIVIDGKLEGDEDADSIKAIFNKAEKSKQDDEGSQEQSPMMSPAVELATLLLKQRWRILPRPLLTFLIPTMKPIT